MQGTVYWVNTYAGVWLMANEMKISILWIHEGRSLLFTFLVLYYVFVCDSVPNSWFVVNQMSHTSALDIIVHRNSSLEQQTIRRRSVTVSVIKVTASDIKRCTLVSTEFTFCLQPNFSDIRNNVLVSDIFTTFWS